MKLNEDVIKRYGTKITNIYMYAYGRDFKLKSNSNQPY